MRLTNQTAYQAKWAPGLDKTGREQLVIIIKATYQLTTSDLPLTLAEEQVPIIEADISTSFTTCGENFSFEEGKTDNRNVQYGGHGEVRIFSQLANMYKGKLKKSYYF